MWTRIPIAQKEVHLATVLACGQSFRWKNSGGVWSIGLGGLVLFLKQDTEAVYWRSEPESKEAAALVEDYLNLKVSLPLLVSEWQARDRRVDYRLHGVRILRQDPWETLCAFICSSNNNIKRISKMVQSLCTEFGPKLGTIDGHDYHGFPAPQAMLDENLEGKLRELGFGYRAKYIAATAQQVAAKPPGYLDSLRSLEYSEAKEALLEFKGVGPKVADCVCLMALDKNDCVPIDTHIWQIAKRDYGLKFEQNAKGYAVVQSHFRNLWGEYAGWAQAVLFAQDLREFKAGTETAETEVKTEIKTEMITEIEIETEIETRATEIKLEPVDLAEIEPQSKRRRGH